MFATMGARNGMSKVVAEALQDFRFKKIRRDETIQKISQLEKKNLMNEPYLLEVALSMLQQR